ncbi:hypothetical protein F5Y19DRAFT_462008 [Xylariaceae sp. FL1651]|nr:hypothetical protein F5Y19DRAFT_462008 [Xylariaceae sp. FL1651]
MAIVAKSDDLAVARREAAGHLQQDLKLSLGQSQSVPDMLMTAPLAINLLGQIKLLAFSYDALRIRLEEPRDGFEYLQRTSFSSAMIQIVDQASNAFDYAEKNIRANRMQINVMFGRNGDKCAARTKETEVHFKALVECVSEVNMAMVDKMTTTAEIEEKTKLEQIENKAKSEIQNNVLDVLKAHVIDAEAEFNEFVEFSALSTAAAIGFGSSVSGIINATISVFKDTPKVAIEAAKAVSSIGTVGVHYTKKAYNSARPTVGVDGQGMAPNQPLASLGVDPAILAAEQIETQLLNLNELLNDHLLTIFEEGGTKILACTRRLEALKNGLALEITSAIITYGDMTKSKESTLGEWEEKISRWRHAMKSLLNRATKLRSFVASLPGQGFGCSLDLSAQIVSPDDPGYSKTLRQRHQKLLITRSAMNDARNNLEKAAELQLQAQAQIVEVARAMGEFKCKHATLGDTKNILRKSLDALGALQTQVRQLTGFFNWLASIISIVCKGHAEQYLRTIDAGITGQGDQLAMAYNEQQLNDIRKTVFTLRGHFSYVVHEADIYLEIATAYISPCIRMAASLPLSAGPDEQEEATRKLKRTTSESSEAIRKLAQRELNAYHKDFGDRVLEIEELSALDLPVPEEDEENLKSIRDGVKESSEGIIEELEETVGLFEEIMDDL